MLLKKTFFRNFKDFHLLLLHWLKANVGDWSNPDKNFISFFKFEPIFPAIFLFLAQNFFRFLQKKFFGNKIKNLKESCEDDAHMIFLA